MSQITTHVLDTSRGKPADDITVILFQQQADNWRQLALGTTDSHGRNSKLLKPDVVLEPGIYRLRFESKAYFDKLGTQCFHPFIEISFAVSSTEHYHIPLLISPWGFTSYRGS